MSVGQKVFDQKVFGQKPRNQKRKKDRLKEAIVCHQKFLTKKNTFTFKHFQREGEWMKRGERDGGERERGREGECNKNREKEKD